MVTEIASLKIF